MILTRVSFQCIVGGLNYYFLHGKDRANLKKKDINKLERYMFLLRIIQFVLIIVVIYRYINSNHKDINVGRKLVNELESIMKLLIISAVLYFIRFIVFLVKKTLRCCFGDDCCRF